MGLSSPKGGGSVFTGGKNTQEGHPSVTENSLSRIWPESIPESKFESQDEKPSKLLAAIDPVSCSVIE